jgi:hypothetical protein
MGQTAIIEPGLTRSCRSGVEATARAVTLCAIRILRWGLVALFGLWLAGCSSMKLAYGNAPTLTWWWLDRHADLDRKSTRLNSSHNPASRMPSSA